MKAKKDKKPGIIFILSTGRAGSQMIAKTLNIHPNICALHEPPPHLNTEAYVRWSAPQKKELILRNIRKKRSRLINQITEGGLVYVESSHYLSLLTDELSEYFPDAKFIHLYRHPIPFVESVLKRSWYKFPKNWLSSAFKRFVRRKFLKDVGGSFEDHRLKPPKKYKTRIEKIAWLYCEINEAIISRLQTIPAEKKLSICLENFNEELLIKLHEFIKVPVSNEYLPAMLELAVSRPNKSESGGASSDGLNRDDENTVLSITGNTMKKLGYSVNKI